MSKRVAGDDGVVVVCVVSGAGEVVGAIVGIGEGGEQRFDFIRFAFAEDQPFRIYLWKIYEYPWIKSKLGLLRPERRWEIPERWICNMSASFEGVRSSSSKNCCKRLSIIL